MLTPAQAAGAVVLRKTLLVSRDDLLAVVREFPNPGVSCSGLDRCLRRSAIERHCLVPNGEPVSNRHDLQAQLPRPQHKPFKACETGYLYVDVKYLPEITDEFSRRCLFVAIDRATRRVFIRIFTSNTAANARRLPHAISNGSARSGTKRY